MDVAIVGEQPLAVRVVEVRAVVDGGLGCGGPAEDAGFPCVACGGGGLVWGGGWGRGFGG